MRLSWTAVIAAALAAGGVVSSLASYVREDWYQMGYAGVLAVAAVAFAMLSLRDR